MAYTGGEVLIVAQMECISGLPADRIINTFAFDVDGGVPDAADYTAMFGHVDDFYRDVTTAGEAAGEFISSWVDRAQTHTLLAYKIQAGDLGSPVAEIPWLGPPAANGDRNMPSEVAAVLSFHADLTGISEESAGTRPKARRRGRIYWGPLRDSGVTNDFNPLTSALLTTTLRQAAVRLVDDSAGSQTNWGVWSRADQVVRTVVGGWTDNALDTQRRRGPESTARIVWAA